MLETITGRVLPSHDMTVLTVIAGQVHDAYKNNS